MRVLFLNQYFYPDMSATAQIMTDLAVDLAAAGIDVTVITGQSAYIGNGRFPAREHHRGVDIIRVPATNLGRNHLVGRAVDFASFFGTASLALSRVRNVDIVVAMSTPPLLSLLGVARKTFSRARFVYWVQDLYPDVAVELGVLSRTSLATRIFEVLSRTSLRGADHVVAIGDCMAEQLQRHRIPDARLSVIPNWADGDAITPVDHTDNWFRREHRLEDKFVALYSGNMGRAHRFDTLIGTAEALVDDPRFAFLFVGGGPRAGEVQEAADRLPNLRVLPYQPREDLAYSLGAADVALISMEDTMAGLIVPSKLYGHMASARPIAFVGPANSSAARTIEATGCGRVFPHGDTHGLAQFLETLHADPTLRRTMGQRGRTAFDASFDRRRTTQEFSTLLGALTN